MDWTEISPYHKFLDYRLRYNRVIDKILVYREEILPGIKGYSAKCFLREKCEKSKMTFYTSADGQGSSKNRREAINIAISEAMERWAFSEYSKEMAGVLTSSGFAAYPELFYFKSKRNARSESFERWCLYQFNNKNLPLEQVDDSTFLFTSKKYYFSLIYQKLDDFVCYGFGAKTNVKSSLFSAQKELCRNKTILKNRHRFPDVDHLYEKRLLFFAQKAGFELFQDFLNTALELRKSSSQFEIKSENKLIGAWSKFRKVYYCQSGVDCLQSNEKVEYFLF